MVDSGSSDDTVRIAESKGAQVVQHAFEGFGAQKNFALSLAQGEWVLSLDADERVSAELADEIIAGDRAARRAIATRCRGSRVSAGVRCGIPAGFRIMCCACSGAARRASPTILCMSASFTDGSVMRLKHPLIHHPVLRLEDALSRMDRYSTAGAEMLVASGRRVSFITGIVRGFWAFIRTYLLRGGFLDGREGFLLAVANAEGTYYRYMKAWLKGRQRG